MPAKKTFQSARFRGPVTFDKGVIIEGNGIASYKLYRALLNQTGVTPPFATILTNTLSGALVFTRQNDGSYVGTLAGAFPIGKTFATINLTSGENGPALSYVEVPTSDDIVITTKALNGDFVDDWQAALEIYVYQ